MDENNLPIVNKYICSKKEKFLKYLLFKDLGNILSSINKNRPDTLDENVCSLIVIIFLSLILSLFFLGLYHYHVRYAHK